MAPETETNEQKLKTG